MIQTCIVHLIRHSLEFVSWKDRKFVVPAFKAIYRAKNAEAGLKALAEFETSFSVSKISGRRPELAAQLGEHVMPFFGYAESVRRIIYTTDEIDIVFSVARFSPGDCRNPTHSSQVPAARANKPPSTRRRRPSPDHNRHTAIIIPIIIPIVPTFPPLRSIRLL